MAEHEERLFVRRPQGELLIELVKPYARFGIDLVMGVRDPSGDIWMGRVVENGNVMYTREAPNVVATPLIKFTDDEVDVV